MTKWLFGAAAAVTAAACTSLTATGKTGEAAPGAPAAGMATFSQNMGMSALYQANCAACHGMQGQGGGAGTKTLLTAELFDQKYDKPFFDTIKNGKADMGMEAFGKSLSDEQIWGLVVHIRELQGRALREKNGSPRAVNGVFNSQRHKFKVETVVDQGLQTPWGIDWLPDGRMLVTNRSGSMVVVKNGAIEATVSGLPQSIELGQGGMMEVAVHPDYAQNGWIYLGYAEPGQANPRAGMTKIVRGKLTISGGLAQWGSQQTVWATGQDNYTQSGVHFGVKIVFDRKGHIFFGVGERGNQDRAQDLSRPNGKVMRLKEDGSIPADNPFNNPEGKAKNALPEIWSYGHRNPQGLVMDLEGNLWDTEHGPRGGDEINRIQKGANYGWPVVAFSINYSDQPHKTPWPKPEQNITLPVFRWLPSIGASGLDVARGAAFPNWKGDLLAGGLAGNNLDRIRIKNDQIVEREELVHGMGRVREVATAPNGTIYLALNGPDKIVRLVPAP